MELSEKSFQDKLLVFAKQNFLILGLFLGGLILIGIGLIQMLGTQTASVKFEKGTSVLGSGDSGDSGSKIKVDVEGEVIKPGVYELSNDARVQDALIAAGGLTSDASRKAINLAAKIADGQKIYVPAIGETVSANVISGSVGGSNNTSNSIISLNSSSPSELEQLPGIGPVSAQKIIDNRPYTLLEELLSKKVVGKTTYEKIKDLISL